MAQYGIKEVMNFTLANYVPDLMKRNPILSVDYAQVTDIENAGERIDISGGRGNARLLSFDHSKTVALNITLPLVDLKMISLISGDEVEESIKKVFRKEILCPTVDSSTGNTFVQLKRKPIEESVYVYKLENGRDLGTQGIKISAPDTITSGAKEFLVDTTNKKISLDPTVFVEGEEIAIYYHAETTTKVETLRVDPNKFPKAVSLFGDTLFRNQFTEEDEVYNVRVHKGRIRPEYTLTMNATDVAVLELTMDVYAYKEQCTGRETYIEYIKDDDADYVSSETGIELNESAPPTFSLVGDVLTVPTGTLDRAIVSAIDSIDGSLQTYVSDVSAGTLTVTAEDGVTVKVYTITLV